MSDNKKIMIIDGNSLMNRAFYALPLLTNSEGEYTNALYGFINMFLKFYDEEKPDYAVVAFDLHKPTFRHIKYQEYKGTRHGMPNELRQQMPKIKEILRTMEISVCEKEGFEADDIMGTLARKCEGLGIQPVIITGDKDLLQIASDKIKIRIPKTKAGKTEVKDYYANDVIEEYGVTPSEFIDVKALMGDKTDNVPGVESIGEKTAIKIIGQYKSLENAIESAEKGETIKPKNAFEKLIEQKETAILSKFLVTIKTDVDVDFSEEFKIGDMFNERVFDIFKKNNFKTFLPRFEKNKYKAGNVEYKYINDEFSAKRFIAELNPWEETAYALLYDDGKICGIAFSNSQTRGTFIELNENEILTLTAEFFESTPKLALDAKKDIVYLKRKNIAYSNLVFDVCLGGYVINTTNSAYEYNDIASDFINESYPSEEEIFGKGKSRKKAKELDKKVLVDFVCSKADVIFRAKPKMLEQLEKNDEKSLYFDMEQPLIFVLADMEYEGIYIDETELRDYGEMLSEKIDKLTAEIYSLAGEEFNINSPKQLGTILFERLGLDGGKKTKTGWSTSADILEKLSDSHEIINKVLEYRTYSKLKSTYVDGLLALRNKESGKIYSSFNQTVTATGRISSSEPNLQNIPIKLELGKRLRKVFKPSKGKIFVDADYSQIELRILAHLSGDENLIKAYNEGQDIHRLTASQVLGIPFDEVTSAQRSSAKVVNFGIIYGKQAFSLSQDLGISKEEADDYINEYFEKYPKVKEFMNNVIENAEKTGYTRTIFNRKRSIPEINSAKFTVRNGARRSAMNMPVQGTSADIIKLAMIRVHERLKNMKSRLILQVHDELLIETVMEEKDEVERLLKEEMENAVRLDVPLEVDVHSGSDWYNAK